MLSIDSVLFWIFSARFNIKITSPAGDYPPIFLRDRLKLLVNFAFNLIKRLRWYSGHTLPNDAPISNRLMIAPLDLDMIVLENRFDSLVKNRRSSQIYV